MESRKMVLMNGVGVSSLNSALRWGFLLYDHTGRRVTW